MKRMKVITFGFFVFTTSAVSALEALNPPGGLAAPKLPTIDTVPGWTYRGCYSDSIVSRTLTGRNYTGYLTPGRCANFCNGYKYFALESGNECFCGNTVAAASIKTPDSNCENFCSGNSRSACGGRSVLSLYEADRFGSTASDPLLLVPPNSTTNSPNPAPPNPPKPPAPPAVVERVAGWTYRGCWNDYLYDRTLIAKRTKGDITPQKCAEICKGYHFFGLEYSNECYCGNLLSPSTSRAPENACSTVCMGNFKAICGGPNRLSLYEAENWNHAQRQVEVAETQ